MLLVCIKTLVGLFRTFAHAVYTVGNFFIFYHSLYLWIQKAQNNLRYKKWAKENRLLRFKRYLVSKISKVALKFYIILEKTLYIYYSWKLLYTTKLPSFCQTSLSHLIYFLLLKMWAVTMHWIRLLENCFWTETCPRHPFWYSRPVSVMNWSRKPPERVFRLF